MSKKPRKKKSNELLCILEHCLWELDIKIGNVDLTCSKYSQKEKVDNLKNLCMEVWAMNEEKYLAF